MAPGASQGSEQYQMMASRTTSCQLPVQPTGAGRNLHRPCQSCDVETARNQDGTSCLPKPQTVWSDYHGDKTEKQKHSGASAHASVALLSVFATLIPLAFVAGFGTAMLAGSSGRHCHSLHLGMPVRLTKGGGDGRQLSYVEHEALSSQEPMQADTRKLVSIQAEALPVPLHPVGSSNLPGANILFVTWIAFGDFGDGGFHTHNFHKVDMRWADVARKSHPGAKIGLILDQDTELVESDKVDFLHRIPIDKKVYGRNEYNDFYHWKARYSMLEKLQAEGHDNLNVVFLDPDIFVLDDIQEVFDHGSFDYATTISENPVQPINGAMHFVRAHHYGGAIEVLKGVLSSFQLRPDMGFTAGQQAYSDFFELTLREDLVKQLQDTAVDQGVACNKIREGDFNICYVICARYNFWEGCTDHPAIRIAEERPEDYAAAHVKVFHFIAYRKLGMTEVYNAFMSGGLEAAYAAWAALPHTEDGYKADPRFGEVV